MRADLEIQRQTWQGRQYWLVKDPLALKYFRFESEELAILKMLDGQTSSDEIRERFAGEFAPQRISASELQSLLANLHKSGLVVVDAAGQGEQLLVRDRVRRRKALWGTLANVLSLRLRGVDPDQFLGWLNGWCGWIFSPGAAVLSALLMLTALALVAAEFDVFRARLPDFQAFFAAKNWLLLAATLAGTKVLHELGHGLACKRFGGQCHEMGVMLLIGTPCLYCNVTDAWMIPSKWRRAAIGAAGMYVELNLAAAATIVWWFSQPGLLHHLCLNVMFVSSVSTLLFNANPLMRFDGYYILADLLEIPNLRQKATAALQRKLGAWLLGLPERNDPFLPTRGRWLFALYAVASAVYGWVVSLSIFWFLYGVLEPYGLKIVGQMLALSMIVGLVVTPALRFAFFLFQPARMQHMSAWRATLGLLGLVAVVVAALAIPLPYYVPCALEVQPRGATSLYVDVPGEVRAIHVAGGTVVAGQSIIELDNIEARQVEHRLAAQRDDLAARIESIRQRAISDDDALLELAQVEEALAALDVQLARRRDELRRLTIVAPVGGILVPPPSRPDDGAEERTRLASWTGRPLESRNLGAYLEASTLVGRIAQPGQWEAILAIEQHEMDFIRAGQRVDLILHQLPGTRLAGRIEHVAQQEMQAASSRLSARGGGELATRTTADGLERPINVIYQASVPLADPSGQIIAGATGRAKIHAGYQTIATRLWRALCRTFRFDL
ncbi:MAG: HlyD family efflux transporter periplasmic adaptor subunit [Pirellulaceae bacterium]|nr:HlyD family efflux transporter periplasmic adaptor subunit [Pirellulaceae bacterium]